MPAPLRGFKDDRAVKKWRNQLDPIVVGMRIAVQFEATAPGIVPF